ncbi:MAG: hypothetical protein P4M09_24740 [Devosia sp.]|nr:hypothetical protein [Devosia sp.]
MAERFEDLQAAAQATNWRGRSGRFYALEPLPIDHFSLESEELYLLARGSDVLWVGTAPEVIGDAARRTAFRTALRVANAAFRIAAPTTEIERLTMAWDLEGAEPVLGLSLT